jgi:hypothetical protein
MSAVRHGLAAVVVAASALALSAAGCGGSAGGGGNAAPADPAAAQVQTIQFQEPEDPGPAPFTEPADVAGPKMVDLPKTPFGGSGSDKVCDRDKLIAFLKAHPDRLREWARVVGVKPTYRAVSKYIARLHPVTLTRDTAVTNHSFVNGRAVPFQSILQAGTAVLVDKYGRPVARCRCGNPLAAPIPQPTARCVGCPAHYRPPPQCRYYEIVSDYDRRVYTSDYYDNVRYDRVFIRRAADGPYADCYVAYPEPPVVRTVIVYRLPSSIELPEPPPPTPAPAPAPAPTHPEPAIDCNNPRSQLEYETCHPPQQAPPPTDHTEQQAPPPDHTEQQGPPRLPECDYRNDC